MRPLNKELEAFAYSISHDLRAPLRHMAGFTQLLQKNTAKILNERNQRYVMMILESAQRMGNLIDDLLAFSRIGRAETHKTMVSLKQLVEEALTEVRQDTEGRNIVWRVGGLPVWYGDRSMLRLVLVNLISNAVKFTRTRSQPEIEIGCLNQEKDEVVVLTSSREERDIVASYSLGVNAYVVKPVDFYEFVNAIRELGVFWAIINETPPGSIKAK